MYIYIMLTASQQEKLLKEGWTECDVIKKSISFCNTGQ